MTAPGLATPSTSPNPKRRRRRPDPQTAFRHGGNVRLIRLPPNRAPVPSPAIGWPTTENLAKRSTSSPLQSQQAPLMTIAGSTFSHLAISRLAQRFRSNEDIRGRVFFVPGHGTQTARPSFGGHHPPAQFVRRPDAIDGDRDPVPAGPTANEKRVLHGGHHDEIPLSGFGLKLRLRSGHATAKSRHPQLCPL